MRILFRHIAPHLLPSAIVWGTLSVATTVLLEATLSFLGVGVQPPQPSWGNIIYESQSYFQAAPWLVFIPGAIILATALSFNLVGDALRDLLDPNSAGTRLMAAQLNCRQLVQAVAVLLGVAVITFLLLHFLPADPAALVAGRSANAQMIASVRHQLGLDLPLPLQFWRYLTGLVQGDLGRSYIQRSAVATLVMARIPATLVLMACGIFIEVILGLTFGVIAALRRNGFVDRVVMMFAFVGVSSPQFVLALLLLYFFAVHLAWFPMSGYGTPAHVVLPALTLGLLGAGWYARMVRSAMIDVLNQDYVRTARAKGLSRPRVVLRHALPNALLPIVAMIGIDIGQFMGGVVVVEAVYGWPGIGQLAWQGIQQADVPIIMGVTLVSSLAIVLANLLADLCRPAAGSANPRSVSSTTKGEVMNRKLLRSAAMALVVSAGLTNFAYAADTPNQDGAIIVTYKDDMATLDPAIGYDWQNWSMINSMFSRLVDYKPGSTELEPSLATSYTVSPDGLTYTFKLNPNAKFTNGRKVVAADVKYSIERAVNPKTQGPGGGFYHSIVGQDKMADGSAQTISGIEAIGDDTVKFTLSQPDATFLNVLALNFASAVPKEVVEAEGADFGKKPLGSGAYILKEWVSGQHLIFVRNPDYFRPRPNLDQFTVEIGQEPLVNILRLQKGEVDIAGDGIPPAKYLEIKNSPDAKDLIVDRSQLETSYITINVTKKPFDDVRVPQGHQHGHQQGPHRAHRQRPGDAGQPSAPAGHAGLRQRVQRLSVRRRRREKAHGGSRP